MKAATFWLVLALLPSGFAQTQPPAPLMPPEQLDNLVAPVALYPDPLLAQVMAASTYPLEIVEAQQWFQQYGNLQGQQLIDAARQQNWDPSVQALVAFPDVLRMLSSDVRWTTDLGNAFLSQQADVMAAVQRMRARAQSNGRLQSTPQQMVTTGTEDGQSAIEIQPASPQVMYVPVYQPQYIWGPPAYGAYPPTWYPAVASSGFGFDPGILLSALFQGFTGWGAWGWVLNWLGHGLFGGGLFGHGAYASAGYGSGLLVNAGFFHHYGLGGGYGGAVGSGLGLWQHNPSHRMGVQYSTGSRYAGSYAGQGAWHSFGGGSSYRPSSSGYQPSAQGFRGYNSMPARGSSSMYQTSRMQSYAAPRSYAASRENYSAPARSYSAPRENYSRSYSAPREQHYSAPRSYKMPKAPKMSHSFSSGPKISKSHSGGGGGRHKR